VVLVQREALPLGPPVVELLVARRRPLVWDVDDALWEPYVSPTAGRVPRWLRASRGKYRSICQRADEVWAGSEVLAEWCRGYSNDVAVVPTVVDVPTERPVPNGARTVCWIGSHSTCEFVEQVLPALTKVNPPARVIVVGAKPAIPSVLAAQVQAWSAEVEERTLAETRVGLYPIDRDHPLAEGKCGLKAILYMSRGIPPVVTPTTTNRHVVRDGVDGLHANTQDEWACAVQRLLDDGDLWERFSRSSHRRASEQFSLAAWAPRIASRLADLARGKT
jgi:glycosyltransferase involved in cell wall biosynthesis